MRTAEETGLWIIYTQGVLLIVFNDNWYGIKRNKIVIPYGKSLRVLFLQTSQFPSMESRPFEV